MVCGIDDVYVGKVEKLQDGSPIYATRTSFNELTLAV